jgi:hypothetical protein
LDIRNFFPILPEDFEKLTTQFGLPKLMAPTYADGDQVISQNADESANYNWDGNSQTRFTKLAVFDLWQIYNICNHPY